MKDPLMNDQPKQPDGSSSQRPVRVIVIGAGSRGQKYATYAILPSRIFAVERARREGGVVDVTLQADGWAR